MKSNNQMKNVLASRGTDFLKVYSNRKDFMNKEYRKVDIYAII